MKKQFPIAVLALHVAVCRAHATIEINVDRDAFGNPIKAPPLLIDTVRLSELCAPLGIHFFGPDGPNGHDGGAIVNEAGNVGVGAHSGTNFLGANHLALLGDGGVPRDPETVTFDTLATNVSIFAAGGRTNKTFLMLGFDLNGVLIASDTITTQNWAELTIMSSLGIKSVQLSVTDPVQSAFAFVFDDLSVDFVPEPSTIYLLLSAATIVVLLRLRRKRS